MEDEFFTEMKTHCDIVLGYAPSYSCDNIESREDHVTI